MPVQILPSTTTIDIYQDTDLVFKHLAQDATLLSNQNTAYLQFDKDNHKIKFKSIKHRFGVDEDDNIERGEIMRNAGDTYEKSNLPE